jgi:four helix bundle protein
LRLEQKQFENGVVLMRDHRKLKAFQLADALVISVYKETCAFPREEMFGLVSQMRRAAVSVPVNIVEGCARNSHAEYLKFLNISFGSLRELGYQIDLASRLGYIPSRKASLLSEQYEETARVLSGLIKSLMSRS